MADRRTRAAALCGLAAVVTLLLDLLLWAIGGASVQSFGLLVAGGLQVYAALGLLGERQSGAWAAGAAVLVAVMTFAPLTFAPQLYAIGPMSVTALVVIVVNLAVLAAVIPGWRHLHPDPIGRRSPDLALAAVLCWIAGAALATSTLDASDQLAPLSIGVLVALIALYGLGGAALLTARRSSGWVVLAAAGLTSALRWNDDFLTWSDAYHIPSLFTLTLNAVILVLVIADLKHLTARP